MIKKANSISYFTKKFLGETLDPNFLGGYSIPPRQVCPPKVSLLPTPMFIFTR